MENITSVLVLDHDSETRAILVTAVEQLGWSAKLADSGLTAIDLLQDREISILIMDLDSAGPDGLEVAKRARRDRAEVDICRHGKLRNHAQGR